MSYIWNKYTKKREISKKNSKIKTYSAIFEPMIKEIAYQNEEEYFTIYEKLKILEYEIKIYDIIEEKDIIYVVLDNDEEISRRIDNEIIPKSFIEEAILLELGKPVNKKETLELFEMEQAMCKIKSKTLIDNELKNIVGTGFFCEIQKENFPLEYCLFTNNHVLNEKYLNNNEILKIEVKKVGNEEYEEKEIKLGNRKKYTNKYLDYTCIEIFKSDVFIKKFFKLNSIIFSNNYIELLNKKEIFILQYPLGKDLSFSYSKILNIKGNIILHSANTDNGSSGSPIIKRDLNNKDYIIGLHYSGIHNKFNLANLFNYIFEDIIKQFNNKFYKTFRKIDNYFYPNYNEIICIYKPKSNLNEIKLLHGYNKDENNFYFEDFKNSYLEAKRINQKIFKENIELYINDEPVGFDFKYQVRDEEEIKVKFLFKTKLISTSFMFMGCLL